jgi:hypothetical protein
MGNTVKGTRVSTVVIVIVLAVVAMLGFLYGVPSGRQARRESLRVFRLARNATGIYAVPALKMRLSSAARGALVVDVYESGRVVVSGRGDPFVRHLAPMLVGEILESAEAALGDFSSEGCGAERGGGSSELYLLLDGRWFGSVCRDAVEWPRGPETKRLLEQLAREIAGLSNRF